MPSPMRRVSRPARAGAAALTAALGLGLAAPPASALVISEVLYDGEGADDGQVFVELFGAPGALLDGLVLEGVNGSNGSITTSVLLAGTIPEDGVFVVADDSGGGMSSVPEADLVLDFDLQNGPDSVVLRDEIGPLDAVGYGDFDADEVFAGEGLPAPDTPAGSSLARLFADVDTDDNSADFTVLDAPTPGTAPVTMVPEPSVAALFGSAMGALGLIGAVRRPRAFRRGTTPRRR